ncbi:MAG: DEAD/DEAH box helicase [Candidatus Omnitrophica bacterium]|nr:DEAD/DEAH box helicase [Candidatus Omnitrophota bacterium]
MDIRKTLKTYKLPEEFIQAATLNGQIKEFYPPQAEAIEKGALDGENLLLAIPTAAGKTLIAELCMIKAIIQTNGRCLYIAPLKALASEKYEEFKKKYSPLGIKVGIAIGDLDSPSKRLNQYQIIIATAEKVDSLLRSRAKWLIDELSVVVLDEIHFINDESRGPTLEILTARIKQLNPNSQILALSATVKNADEIALWLGAKFVQSTWRPVPLREGVYFGEQITFKNAGRRLVKEELPDDLSKLALDTLRSKGQILVFVNSRRSAQASSLSLCKAVDSILSPEEKKKLKSIARNVLSGSGESTKICRKLANVVEHGVAFHHAGLRPHQRKLIEDSFKQNIIKIICSTPTLAAGVNLPARRTILRDTKRYQAGVGAAYIPASEYKQCAGRAGRPGYDEYGEAVIIAKSLSESQLLFDRYINADPEPVISKLGNESALRMHVLAAISAGHVHDINEMFEFISHTFLAHQRQTSHLIEMISEIFEFLEEEQLVEKSGFRYFATAFGHCVSRLYIDPITGIILRNGLKKIHENKAPLTVVGLLHLICCCPDTERTVNLAKSIYDDLENFAAEYREDFVMTRNDVAELDDMFFYMTTLKTAWFLSCWIDEEKEENICEKFNMGPGDIHRHTESVRWIFHAASVIAELFKFKRLTFETEDLRNRVRYGIREELLELVSLKGVGRVRARNLFEKGHKRLSELKFVSLDDLSSVDQIGKTLAKEILSQLNRSKF